MFFFMGIFFTNSAKLLSILAILSLLIVSSAAVMAQDQTAPLPTWTKGQTWAVGGDRDLSGLMGDNLTSLQSALALLGNISIDKLQLSGTAGAWSVFKVTDVTQNTYLLEYCAGLCVHACLQVQAHGDMPSAGNYNVANMTKDYKSVSGEACFELMITCHGFATIDKATMAVIGVNSTGALDERLTLNAINFPSYSTSISMNGMSLNMSYQNCSVNECLHLELASNISFDPALNMLRFPLTVGNNWTVDSRMTYEGTAKGNFNETGLPSSAFSGLSTRNGTFNGSAVIRDMKMLGSMPMNNGTIGPVTVDLNTTMQCLGEKQLNDCFGHNITVFDVKESRSGADLGYSPDTGFLTTFIMIPQLDMMKDVVTVPGGIMINALNLSPEISIASADPDNATNEISQIAASQGVQSVSLVPPGDTGTPATGQDSSMMLMLVAAIVVIAACIGGAFIVRKRTKKGP